MTEIAFFALRMVERSTAGLGLSHREYTNPTCYPYSRMRIPGVLVALVAALALTGCHSALIDATISNRTTQPLSLIEVDYPSASFGTQSLAPGQDFHYRFKVLGNGPTALLWTDTTHHDRKLSGPPLREGDEGKLAVTFNPNADPKWDLQLINRSSGS
jgi:hypothetical protein